MGINEVFRTQVSFEGYVPESDVQAMFEKVCGDKLASAVVSYDEAKTKTLISILPCRIYATTVEQIAGTIPVKGHEVVVKMAGTLPKAEKHNIIERDWVPFRSKCKRAKDEATHNIGWVVVYPPQELRDIPSGKCATTSFGFAIDNRCPKGQEYDALIEAATFISEHLRKIVENADAVACEAAHLANDLMTSLVNELDSWEMDRIEANYAEKHLRHINMDDHCTV